MAILLGALYLSGALTVVDHDLHGTGAGTTNTFTAAEARDGSDATVHTFVAPDGPGVNGQGNCDVFAALDAPAPVGTIQFLRVKIRARLFKALGPGPFLGTAYFYSNGLVTSIGTPGTGFTALQVDVATNPSTGSAWTAADLLAAAYGFRLAAESTDPAFGSVIQHDISEYSIEVWGLAGVATGVKASYGDAVDKAVASGIVEG
jgi:hypothetical protein